MNSKIRAYIEKFPPEIIECEIPPIKSKDEPLKSYLEKLQSCRYVFRFDNNKKILGIKNPVSPSENLFCDNPQKLLNDMASLMYFCKFDDQRIKKAQRDFEAIWEQQIKGQFERFSSEIGDTLVMITSITAKRNFPKRTYGKILRALIQCEDEILKMIHLPVKKQKIPPIKELFVFYVLARHLPKASDASIFKIMAHIYKHFNIEKGPHNTIHQNIKRKLLRFINSIPSSPRPAKN